MSTGSRFRAVAIFAMMSRACAPSQPAQPASTLPTPAPTRIAPTRPPPNPAERELGVTDHGIWGDLDERVQIDLPDDLAPDHVTATVDDTHHLLVLSIDGFPRKVYPLAGSATLE